LSNFEYIYKDGVPSEKPHVIEKSYCIEVHNKPPPIPMVIEATILEKQIAEKGMHPNEKSKSKSTARKPKKVHRKTK
jgi:hypothetical protein